MFSELKGGIMHSPLERIVKGVVGLGKMGRAVPRSAEAIAAARKFLGSVLHQGTKLCHVLNTDILEKWKVLRGRKVRGVPWVSDEAFLKALSRVGGDRRRLKRGGKPCYVWCVGCDHVTSEWRVPNRNKDQGDEEEESEEEDEESEEEGESMEENEEYEEEDKDGEARRMVSYRTYRALLKRYERLKKGSLTAPASTSLMAATRLTLSPPCKSCGATASGLKAAGSCCLTSSNAFLVRVGRGRTSHATP